MRNPVLSVVVPTRNRASTLRHCLKTVLSQHYPALQVVVSDNCSTDDTQSVVAGLGDQRLSYVRADRPLSMTDNWNFGLEAATGDFVTFIGDDDGFLPGAIETGMATIAATGMRALSWRKMEYHWPNYPLADGQNLLHGQSEPIAFSVDGHRKCALVLSFREGYNRLPCVYNAIVSMDSVREVMTQSPDSQFFGGLAPDVYSGIVLSQVVGRYVELRFPLTVNGASARSNGMLTGLTERSSAQRALAEEFFALEHRIYDDTVRVCASGHSMVMGEFLLARSRLPAMNWPQPHWHRYVRALVRDARGSAARASILASAEHTAERRGLRFARPRRGDSRASSPKTAHSLTGSLMLDPTLIGNVDEAARLLASLVPRDVEIERRPTLYFAKQILRQSMTLAKDLIRVLYSS